MEANLFLCKKCGFKFMRGLRPNSCPVCGSKRLDKCSNNATVKHLESTGKEHSDLIVFKGGKDERSKSKKSR